MRSLIKKQNKKGNAMLIIIFFIVLFVVLFVGFMMAVGSSIVNWVWDEAAPELTELGVIADTNLTEVSAYTITPVNEVIQSFTWLTGVLYMIMLFGCFGVVYISRTTPSKWLIVFYFMLTIILIMGCIFISNMYEEFYTGTDELATRLQEHTLLSWMILYSPMIFTVLVFATGIVLFSGVQQEEFT